MGGWDFCGKSAEKYVSTLTERESQTRIRGVGLPKGIPCCVRMYNGRALGLGCTGSRHGGWFLVFWQPVFRNQGDRIVGADAKNAKAPEAQDAGAAMTPEAVLSGEHGELITPEDVTFEELRAAEFDSATENVIFSRFLYELRHQEPATRAKAARGMGGLRHELSVKALVAQLSRDPSEEVRKECVNALTALEMSEGLEAVEKALDDEAVSVRLAAVRGVYRLAGMDAADRLVAMFADESELVRCRAVTCIGWLGDHRLAEPLMPLLADGSVAVRRTVVEALGEIAAPKSFPSVISRMTDPDESVRRKALAAISMATEKNMDESLPPDADPPEYLIARWREWWKENSSAILGEEDALDYPDVPSAPAPEQARRVVSRERPAASAVTASPIAPDTDDGEDTPSDVADALVASDTETDDDSDDTGLPRSLAALAGDEEFPEDSFDIISIVQDLEKELDTAFDLKESLESDLRRTREQLEAETAIRRDLENQLGDLESQAAQAHQLAEEINFVKEERNSLYGRIQDATSQVEKITKERDQLLTEKDSAGKHIKNLEREKIDLEAQVFTLKDKVKDYNELKEQRGVMENQAQELSARLQDSEDQKNALQLDLAKLRKIVRRLRQENDSLRKELSTTTTDASQMRSELQHQQAENRELQETRNRLQRELTMLTAEHETTTQLLDKARAGLKAIRSAAMKTTERFRDRGTPQKDGE